MLRVEPGGTVPSHVFGLTAALAMLADLGGQWCRFWRLAALALLVVPRRVRRAQCPLAVPEIVLELDLLPLVDQLLANQQERIDGGVTSQHILYYCTYYSVSLTCTVHTVTSHVFPVSPVEVSSSTYVLS